MRYSERRRRARERMAEVGVDVLLLSIGADLPYLTGYEAVPLERLTMLVVRADDDPAVLVVPRLEAPRADVDDGVEVVAWEETDDPVALVARAAGRPRVVGVGDQTWARFVLALQRALPGADFRPATEVTAPLRAVKDDEEVAALARAAVAVDRVVDALTGWPFAGRREVDVHRDIVEAMLSEGHRRANFAIVAAGEDAASPHHDPSEREIREGDVVLCDFGGVLDGYCSDITRMFHVGEPAAEVREAYAALREAQERAVRAARVGTPCEEVDAVARAALAEAGLAERFVHRLGHGIGLEAHEDPYLVAGNAEPLRAGHVFSVEPGVYLPGRFGLRLEDIVVATEAGPRRLNGAPRDLRVVA